MNFEKVAIILILPSAYSQSTECYNASYAFPRWFREGSAMDVRSN